MKKVIVVGGGAAGMMAAIAASQISKDSVEREGNKVILLEKNEKLGKKVYITGKGRCNLTNSCDTDELFKNFVHNGKFMYSSIYAFDNKATIEFFESIGLKVKYERGNRVFPESDHSSDVIKVLQKELLKRKVDIRLNTEVKSIIVENGVVTGVKLKNEDIHADAVILATGGVSYPSTGSTGDGIRWAENTGHNIKPLIQSLVPFEVKEMFVSDLMGLSLKNVEASIYDSRNKLLYKEFGEMLFTHFGVSGPIMISASAVVNEKLINEELKLYINLKPAMSHEELDRRVLREFDMNRTKQFKNAVTPLFPGKLAPVMVMLSGIDPDIKVCDITAEKRNEFVSLMQKMPLTITGMRDFNEAIITRGGVSVKDINPKTMESKAIKNLYFAGEMIDVDAYTGGFNLQIAWSTGMAAGRGIDEI
ncbi:MAG: NAD(P)/FAD-dependent oxidoreductase [Lachnospiraceae bacterium]|nr:NAD(P)/FAD-dependent oxidoreductase [Lachnospiraceae bacterium]